MTQDGARIAAIVLAAGRGTRFAGATKMLATLHGTALVRHVVEAALASGLHPVLVVTGHEAEAVAAALHGTEVLSVPNPSYADGLSSSLRTGFAALPEDVDAAAILLGDMPGIGPDLLARLGAAWEEAGRPAALVPTHAGLRGNPVVLSRQLAPEIASLTGDVGAGPLLRGRPDVVEVAVDDPAVALDVDTAESLAAYASTTPRRIAT